MNYHKIFVKTIIHSSLLLVAINTSFASIEHVNKIEQYSNAIGMATSSKKLKPVNTHQKEELNAQHEPHSQNMVEKIGKKRLSEKQEVGDK